MLPDFPEVKAHLRATLFKFTQQQLPRLAPLLGQVGRFRQHEGRTGHLVRHDTSSETLNYPGQSFSVTFTREEMKMLDLHGIIEKFKELAEQMAASEERMMFATIYKDAQSVGNTVSTSGEFGPETLFAMLSRVEMNFDPETGEPVGHSFVMHPDTAAKVIPLVKQWETDPAFIAEHTRIMNAKREEWRVREDRRRLVD